jgi:hypothetical protein
MSTADTTALTGWRQPRAKLAAGVFVGLLVGLLLAVTVGGVPWRDYVRRQPPAVVALSFLDPATLPAGAAADGTVHFRFSVENQQAHSYVASYTTVVIDTVTNEQLTVRSGEVPIAAGATTTLDGQATITGTHRQQVLVRLASGQSIDFYVTPAGEKASQPVGK